MKNSLSFIYLFLLTLLVSNSAIGQTNEIGNIVNSIVQYNSQHLSEKIYLHTDKSVYINNEVCWFKIYAVDGFFHQPLSLNKVVYVELLDDKNQVVLQDKIEMTDAKGNGSFLLPANIPTGNYQIIAYTNWMKNFDQSFFFKKTIKIINTLYSPELVSNKNTNNQISIFPESGNLLNGVINRLGFSIKTAYGNSEEAKGWLIKNNIDTILSVKTIHGGLGQFSFTPSSQDVYKLVLQTTNGYTEQKLPSITNTGWILQLNQSSNNISGTVFNTNKDEKVFLIIHCRGIVKKAFAIKTTDGRVNVDVPNEILGEGINTFTLFNSDKQPVAERLFFKFPSKTNAILKTESAYYKKRQKINFSVETKFSTDFESSISVYKIDSLQPFDQINIENYLWLSSDLVGQIEKPAYYFDETNKDRFEAMDNLMLTQGWRRFSMDIINENNVAKLSFLPELGGSIITGKVLSNKKDPSINTVGYISSPSKKSTFQSAISDSLGKIQFELNQFNNNGQIIAQVDDAGNKIELDNPFVMHKESTNSLKSIDIIKLPKQILGTTHKNLQIQQLYQPNSTNQFKDLQNDTIPFYHKADRTYFLDDYARFATLEEVIREYVTPVTLVKKKEKYQLFVYDEAYKKFFETNPLVLLDGVVIKDIDKLLEYDPLKIRKVDIISRQYYLGNISYNGIINFTTYSGKLEAFEIDPTAVVLNYKGLQEQRIFAAPVYETQFQIDNRTPDFRQVLYWNPHFKFNQNGKQAFYSSDIPGKYVLNIQGISSSGKFLNEHVYFEVR
jgi:hypothetical protein